MDLDENTSGKRLSSPSKTDLKRLYLANAGISKSKEDMAQSVRMKSLEGFLGFLKTSFVSYLKEWAKFKKKVELFSPIFPSHRHGSFLDFNSREIPLSAVGIGPCPCQGKTPIRQHFPIASFFPMFHRAFKERTHHKILRAGSFLLLINF